jgi:hypothetical protein
VSPAAGLSTVMGGSDLVAEDLELVAGPLPWRGVGSLEAFRASIFPRAGFPVTEPAEVASVPAWLHAAASKAAPMMGAMNRFMPVSFLLVDMAAWWVRPVTDRPIVGNGSVTVLGTTCLHRRRPGNGRPVSDIWTAEGERPFRSADPREQKLGSPEPIAGGGNRPWRVASTTTDH